MAKSKPMSQQNGKKSEGKSDKDLIDRDKMRRARRVLEVLDKKADQKS